MAGRVLSLFAALALAVPSAGCLQVEYLVQAAEGQDDIAYRARPITEVLADEREPASTRRLLAMVADVKAFAEANGLVATNSYATYADLERPAAVWVVTAAPPLSLDPETWTFPIVGTVPYLGWFERHDAERQAVLLREDGLDVYVRPARAYSTLGWFDDPVLSTMLGAPHEHDDASAAGLVEVVLHESVHATTYVKSQSLYNESLATFVAEELTPLYLQARPGGGARQRSLYEEGLAEERRREARVQATCGELDKLYRSQLAKPEKLREKRRLLASLERELGLDRELNNAALAQAQTYDSGGVALAELYQACGRDMPRFLRAVGTLNADSFAEPQALDLRAVLAPLIAGGCQGG